MVLDFSPVTTETIHMNQNQKPFLVACSLGCKLLCCLAYSLVYIIITPWRPESAGMEAVAVPMQTPITETPKMLGLCTLADPCGLLQFPSAPVHPLHLAICLITSATERSRSPQITGASRHQDSRGDETAEGMKLQKVSARTI
jgi:hypothetical protein